MDHFSRSAVQSVQIASCRSKRKVILFSYLSLYEAVLNVLCSDIVELGGIGPSMFWNHLNGRNHATYKFVNYLLCLLQLMLIFFFCKKNKSVIPKPILKSNPDLSTCCTYFSFVLPWLLSCSLYCIRRSLASFNTAAWNLTGAEGDVTTLLLLWLIVYQPSFMLI